MRAVPVRTTSRLCCRLSEAAVRMNVWVRCDRTWPDLSHLLIGAGLAGQGRITAQSWSQHQTAPSLFKNSQQEYDLKWGKIVKKRKKKRLLLSLQTGWTHRISSLQCSRVSSKLLGIICDRQKADRYIQSSFQRLIFNLILSYVKGSYNQPATKKNRHLCLENSLHWEPNIWQK